MRCYRVDRLKDFLAFSMKNICEEMNLARFFRLSCD